MAVVTRMDDSNIELISCFARFRPYQNTNQGKKRTAFWEKSSLASVFNRWSCGMLPVRLEIGINLRWDRGEANHVTLSILP